MEYVSGESLKDVIDRNPNGMPLEEVKFWFGGIAAGVAYLHDHGIVHRDLKPGNIFRDEGVVKIGDYGLSKFISCSRRSGQTESVGTFHYMAPEIGKGVYGKEIDIYALGIILCEMLTGRVPFEGESSQEIIMKHLTADPDLRQVPPRFRRVIERALFKDPAKRYRSVGEMLRAMQLDGRADVPAAESVNIQPVDSRCRRGRAGRRIRRSHSTSTAKDSPPTRSCSAQSWRWSRPTWKNLPWSAAWHPVANRSLRPSGSGYQRFTHWWTTANLSTPIKVGLVAGAIAVAVSQLGMAGSPGLGLRGGLSGVLRRAHRDGRFARPAGARAGGYAGATSRWPTRNRAGTGVDAPARTLARAGPRKPAAQTGRTTACRTDRFVSHGSHRVGRPVSDHSGGRRPETGRVGRHLDVFRVAHGLQRRWVPGWFWAWPSSGKATRETIFCADS